MVAFLIYAQKLKINESQKIAAHSADVRDAAAIAKGKNHVVVHRSCCATSGCSFVMSFIVIRSC